MQYLCKAEATHALLFWACTLTFPAHSRISPAVWKGEVMGKYVCSITAYSLSFAGRKKTDLKNLMDTTGPGFPVLTWN